MSTSISLNNRRKLHPLMPIPQNTTYSALPTGSVLHPHQVSDTKTEPVISSRWNPTKEQIRALEEIYRSGTKTPTADQIQKIVSMLRRFGRVEGKNVFYWFQNHKARERQKRIRQQIQSLSPSPSLFKQHNNIRNYSEKKELIQRRLVPKRDHIDEQIPRRITKARVTIHEDENRESKTLQLFPSCDYKRDDAALECGINVNALKNCADDQVQITSSTYTSFVRSNPVQFFEFLPLKS